jgi:hypothetical protein
MKKQTQISKKLDALITEVNELLPQVNNCNSYAYTYAGSTMCYYIILDEPIIVKGKYVYIKTSKFSNNYNFENRYNANNKDIFSDNGEKALLYDLRIIKKAFIQLLKN